MTAVEFCMIIGTVYHVGGHVGNDKLFKRAGWGYMIVAAILLALGVK